MIALSVAFLARERLVLNADSLTKRHLGLVAFFFGLLHGFGFSSVLFSIGLPEEEIPLALLSFNVGVELGQLAFVAFAYVGAYFLGKYAKRYEENVLRVLVYVIGTVSFYWFIQRSELFNFL